MADYDYIVKKGDSLKELTVQNKSMLVNSGASVYKIALKNSAVIDLYGTALQVSLYTGDVVLNVYSGAAKNTITYYGSFNIIGGGSAYNSTIYYGSYMNVSNGHSFNDTIYGGVMNVGTDSENDKIKAVAENTVISTGGIMNVSQAGQALSATVKKDGSLNVNTGGTAVKTVIETKGSMTVSNGAFASDTSIAKQGTLYLENGSVHNGRLDVAEGGRVVAADGAKINITISGQKPSKEYCITNQALIEGSPVFTVYAAKNQSSGSYKLIENIAELSQLDIVINAGKKDLNYTLNANQTGFVYNKNYWYLLRTDDDLILSVAKPPKAPKITVSNKKYTNQNVIVSAAFSAGSVNCEYSFDNLNWFEYTSAGVEVTENCTIYFRSESAKGIISPVSSYTVSNIDKVMPEITELLLEKHPKNINAVLKKVVAEDLSGIQSIEYKVNDGEWAVYNAKKAPKVNENGKLYIKVTDKAGNEKIFEQDLLFDSYTQDDWQDVKIEGANSAFIGRNNYAVSAENGDLKIADWVGLDDVSDYHEVDIQDAGAYSFSAVASDKGKLTVYRLVEKSNGTFKLQSLQNTTLAYNKDSEQYGAETKNLLLTEGKYYLCMTSTNAKSGAISDYEIKLSDKTIFYPAGKIGHDDDLSDLKNSGITLKDSDKYLVGNAKHAQSFVIGSAENAEWVGFGDAVDYKEFKLDGAAVLSFEVNASQKTSFTIYQLVSTVDKKGVTTYKLKALQTSKLKAAANNDNYSVVSKDLLLGKGTYYLGISSDNAAKGGSSSYSVKLNHADFIIDNSKSYMSDNSDDTWKLAAEKDAVDSVNNWVGFGDAADFFKINVAENGKVSFDCSDNNTLSAINDKELKITCLNSKGKSVALIFENDSFVSAKELAAGTYYIGIQCANVKKYNTEYNIVIDSSC